MFMKLSLGAFFLRILVEPWQRSTVYVIICVSTVTNFTIGFYDIFFCGNPTSIFDKIFIGKCAPYTANAGILYLQAVVNTLTDVALAMLPVPLLWNSKMNTKSKISVGLILMLASGGCIAAMIRFKYLTAILHPTLSFFSKLNSKSVWLLRS